MFSWHSWRFDRRRSPYSLWDKFTEDTFHNFLTIDNISSRISVTSEPSLDDDGLDLISCPTNSYMENTLFPHPYQRGQSRFMAPLPYRWCRNLQVINTITHWFFGISIDIWNNLEVRYTADKVHLSVQFDCDRILFTLSPSQFFLSRHPKHMWPTQPSFQPQHPNAPHHPNHSSFFLSWSAPMINFSN